MTKRLCIEDCAPSLTLEYVESEYPFIYDALFRDVAFANRTAESYTRKWYRGEYERIVAELRGYRRGLLLTVPESHRIRSFVNEAYSVIEKFYLDLLIGR